MVQRAVPVTGKLTLQTLVLPIFLENVLKNLMGTVNVLILSALSDQSVAAVGVATQVFQMILTVFNVCSNGAVVVICQSLGSGNRRTASEATSTSLFLVSALSLLLSLLCFSASPLLIRWMQVEPALTGEAVSYLRIISMGGFFEGLISAIAAILRSYGKPRYGLYATLLMNLLNALGGWIVVFRPFETPFSGVSGVAWMRVLSEILAALTMVFILLRLNLTGSRRSLLQPKAAMIRPILHIAIPSGVETFSYSLSQTVTTAIVATLGAASISAKVYVQNIVHYVYLLGLSVGTATSIMIGHCVGAGEYDKALEHNKRGLKLAMSSNAVFSLAVLLLRWPLLGLFTRDPEILSIAAPIMVLDFFVEMGRAVNHIEQFSLRAVSDVRVPMCISLATSWGCSILFSYILGVRLGLGLPGCWIAYGMEEVVRCTLLLRRWKKKDWIRKLQEKKASVA